MRAILSFITNHGLFLFEQYGFRFVDSLYSKSFGGDAYITLKSENLKIRLVYDRAQLFMDFCGNNSRKEHWFSIDLIVQLLTEEIQQSSLLDERYANFIAKNMDAIIEAFSDANVEATQSSLNKLAKQRAKRLFG